MPTEREAVFLVTCEHAVNAVPAAYAHLFKEHQTVLDSHRGYDIGALAWAHQVSRELGACLFVGEVTRLLIELNRAVGPALWSEYSGRLSDAEKAAVQRRYYDLYRQSVESCIKRAVNLNLRVIHISVHTFTPVLDGVAREVDIGVLFDPERSWESKIATLWLQTLARRHSKMTVRPNEPYHGRDDGFTTYLRTRFEGPTYAGIEIEVKNTITTDIMLLKSSDIQETSP